MRQARVCGLHGEEGGLVDISGRALSPTAEQSLSHTLGSKLSGGYLIVPTESP